MMEFAGDSSGYSAGGAGYPGALPATPSAYGSGGGGGAGVVDPRRLQGAPPRPAAAPPAQLPLPGASRTPAACCPQWRGCASSSRLRARVPVALRSFRPSSGIAILTPCSLSLLSLADLHCQSSCTFLQFDPCVRISALQLRPAL